MLLRRNKDLLGSYKKLKHNERHSYTQNYAQSAASPKKAKIGSKSQKNTWAGSLARTGHEPPKLGVAGSNPAPPAMGLGNLRYRQDPLRVLVDHGTETDNNKRTGLSVCASESAIANVAKAAFHFWDAK